MRALLRFLGGIVLVFLILVFATATVRFIRKFWFGRDASSRGHIAVLDISGILLSDASTLRDLDEILENKNTKAIVVRVNSPGGLVAPSQELLDALEQADKKVPVLVSMGSVAASGGYYVSLGARKIYAEPGTLTASIGVIMEFLNTEKLYQWAKVDRFTITAGKLKDAGSPFRPMKPEERDFFTRLLTNVHEQFRLAVKTRRKLTDTELNAVADGRVMTGQQAFESKLVDALGGFPDAVREAKKLAKLPESAPIQYPEEDTGLLKKLLLGEKAESLLKKVSGLFRDFPSTLVATPGWTVMLLAPVRG